MAIVGRTIQPRMRRRRKAKMHERDALHRAYHLHMFAIGVGSLFAAIDEAASQGNEVFLRAVEQMGVEKDWTYISPMAKRAGIEQGA